MRKKILKNINNKNIKKDGNIREFLIPWSLFLIFLFVLILDFSHQKLFKEVEQEEIIKEINEGETQINRQEFCEGDLCDIPSQLFDISFEIEENKIDYLDDLNVIVNFESFGRILSLVNLTFIILDEYENIVYIERDFVIIETEKVVRKQFKNLNLFSGKYIFVLKTLYNIDVVDEFEQEFEVLKNIYSFVGRHIYIFVFIIIGSLILLVNFVIKFYKNKKGGQEDARTKNAKSVKKNFVLNAVEDASASLVDVNKR